MADTLYQRVIKAQHNRRFKVVSCFIVTHPQFFEAGSVDIIEDQVQACADRKAIREDRPAIGELTFNHMLKSTGHEIHAFFINRHGKKRRFMKLQEVAICPANDK